ncbi:MAG: helix-turn-helix transcriptional regulator [Bryobacteraceae bacterium]
MKLTDAVKALRLSLSESQQAFATRLGISIRALVNYEKDREPPLTLLLRLSAVAREAGKEGLAGVFEWAFYEQISNATAGHRISFLQEDETGGQNSGLMLLTFGEGQFEYASAFLMAMGRLEGAENPRTQNKARAALDSLVKAVHSAKFEP